MIRITKQGDPRLLRTYRKFTCKACGCEFIADDADYTVEKYAKPYSYELDPLGLKDTCVTKFAATCPCCETYIYTDEAEEISYKEIVKFDEKEKKAHVWG